MDAIHSLELPPAAAVTTLVDLLRARALATPDRRAYAFLADGESESAALSWAECDARARAVGAALTEQGARGERILLLFPPGLDFVAAFFGCLYAGDWSLPLPRPHPSCRIP
jgi:acyl-CoA synthetase (AMP-forming)/AMP-acid ligase II